MRLSNRVKRLSEQMPVPRRQTNIPTATLTEFIRGLLSGTFTFTDLDRTNYDHMGMLSLFGVTLVVLGPGHQAYCDENPWARTQQDEWETKTLLLTPTEIATLRAMAENTVR